MAQCSRRLIRCQGSDEVQRALTSIIANVVVDARSRCVTIGVSGGSMIKFVAKSLHDCSNVKWDNIYFVMCDERHCPFSSNDSNYGSYERAITDERIKARFVKIDPTVDLDSCAFNYEKKLASIQEMPMVRDSDGVQWPRFDLLLLGMGPDGHTCSLFPDDHPVRLPSHGLGWVGAVSDAPKPPPNRITLTFPVINRAKNCTLVITGSGKQQAVDDLFSTASTLPIGQVQPTTPGSSLIYIIDQTTISIPDSVALMDFID